MKENKLKKRLLEDYSGRLNLLFEALIMSISVAKNSLGYPISSTSPTNDPRQNSREQAESDQVQTMPQVKIALIADDDEFFRMAIRVILIEKLGFSEVIEAASLDSAIESLSFRDDISLALFDLAMPGMKSAASLRAVRENFADLKVAVVSGSRRREDVLLALTSGMNGYVPKSLGAACIRDALALVMDGLIYVPHLITDLHEEDRCQAVDETQAIIESLTPRQKDVLGLLIEAKSNKEIARILDLSEGTIKVHLSALFRILGTNSRSAAAIIGAKALAG
jgi:DNA-binding NarL/FixJ family response regulator